MNAVVRCSIRSRQQEGSCNSCQRRDQEIVILVELNTLSFRVCDRCAKELAEKVTALLSPNRGICLHSEAYQREPMPAAPPLVTSATPGPEQARP